MSRPEFIFVTGCNASGKSSFIRSRINKLEGFEIIMTDVFKHRTKDLVRAAIRQKRDIILESVFNDESFKELIDEANNAGYNTSLIVLFLDDLQQSIDRVAIRALLQNGLMISADNIRLNFNASFTNVCHYYFYFDRADFIYTGSFNENVPILNFRKAKLTANRANELQYPRKLAEFAFRRQRMNQEAYHVILENKDKR